jgi:chemotaxis protein CheY-P-specific phosphatase CheC
LNHRAIVDVVCKSALQKLAGEIGVLLGKELQCADIQLRLTSKAAFFQDLIREKSALTRMTVGGDQPGECYLLTRIDSAVYLGGTLIMLPQDMIEEHAQNGKLEGELEDAFGEVANIIAGVFTQAFVDKYPKTIRFIKNTVEELVPTKVDLASAQPFPPGAYYIASATLKAEEKDLGPVELVVPAAVFGLEEIPPAAPAAEPKEQAPAADSGWGAVAAQAKSAPSTGWAAVEAHANPTPAPAADSGWGAVAAQAEAAEPAGWPAATPPRTEEEPVAAAPAPAPSPQLTLADAKKLTDLVFKTAFGQLSEEIGALIGQDLKYDDIQLIITSKADFFATHCQEKSILAHLKVSGAREGLGFLAVQTPDAVILGGTLIMLPEEQIEEQAQKFQFEGEVADAFGEVANILAGGLTQVFLDRYPKQLRFTKTGMEQLIPTRLDLTSDQPFPEDCYYLASVALNLKGYELHRLQLLFPARFFDLDPSQAATAGDTTGAAQVAPQPTAAPAPSVQPEAAPKVPPPAAPAAPPVAAAAPVVLIISEQPIAAEPFVKILSSSAHSCKVLGYQDDIRQIFLQYQVLGVFLVMNQVGEKGFATAIKLQSTGRPMPPLIFAGPEWTRSAVLRAVKYGARDIIILPASNDEIQEKVSRHFRKAS